MTPRKKIKYLHEGTYVAEVEVELTDDAGGWSPCFSVEDARKLDEVRIALRKGDLASASHLAKIYELRPVMNQ